jgi:hypothetical protein
MNPMTTAGIPVTRKTHCQPLSPSRPITHHLQLGEADVLAVDIRDQVADPDERNEPAGDLLDDVRPADARAWRMIHGVLPFRRGVCRARYFLSADAHKTAPASCMSRRQDSANAMVQLVRKDATSTLSGYDRGRRMSCLTSLISGKRPRSFREESLVINAHLNDDTVPIGVSVTKPANVVKSSCAIQPAPTRLQQCRA